jgi:hypothetical protein
MVNPNNLHLRHIYIKDNERWPIGVPWIRDHLFHVAERETGLDVWWIVDAS